MYFTKTFNSGFHLFDEEVQNQINDFVRNHPYEIEVVTFQASRGPVGTNFHFLFKEKIQCSSGLASASST